MMNGFNCMHIIRTFICVISFFKHIFLLKQLRYNQKFLTKYFLMPRNEKKIFCQLKSLTLIFYIMEKSELFFFLPTVPKSIKSCLMVVIFEDSALWE